MRLIEKNGTEQTYYDGAQINYYICGGTSGRIFGVNLTKTSQQILTTPGLLVVKGYRVSFGNEAIITFNSFPQNPEIVNLILRITVTENNSNASIVTGDVTYKDEIDKTTGIYDYLMATFILTSDGVSEISTQMINIGKNSIMDSDFEIIIADKTEAESGIDNTKMMTALRTSEAISKQVKIPIIASQDEAEAGTDNSKMMTPRRTAEAIAVLGGGGGGGWKLVQRFEFSGTTRTDTFNLPSDGTYKIVGTGAYDGDGSQPPSVKITLSSSYGDDPEITLTNCTHAQFEVVSQGYGAGYKNVLGMHYTTYGDLQPIQLGADTGGPVRIEVTGSSDWATIYCDIYKMTEA